MTGHVVLRRILSTRLSRYLLWRYETFSRHDLSFCLGIVSVITSMFREKRSMTRIDIYCLLLAIGGGALVFWAKRRAFLRTNSFGVELFPTYGRSLLARIADGTLIACGLGMIGSSLLILLVEYAGEWLVAAFILYVIYLLEQEWYERRK